MPSKKEKHRRKAIREELAVKAHAEFLQSLPFPLSEIRKLVDHVEDAIFSKAGDPSCDHTLTVTRQFLSAQGYSSEETLDWILEQGGGCDCEVVYNVSEVLDDD